MHLSQDQQRSLETILGGAVYVERFISRVDSSQGGCHNWLRGCDGQGYGAFRTPVGLFKAHRLSLAARLGRYPASDEHVLHSCDNPTCCNPEHLRLGTHAENMQDMFARNRRKAARGERASRSKLTEKQVEEIREVYTPNCKTPGRRSSDIAARYGITRQQVNAIGKGRSWSN